MSENKRELKEFLKFLFCVFLRFSALLFLKIVVCFKGDRELLFSAHSIIIVIQEDFILTSIMPFLNFLMSFAGLLLLFIGVVQIVSIRRQFSLYFDKRDEVAQDTDKIRKRKLIFNVVLAAAGIILFVLSYII